ncbi:MAG: endolytic transglycosylase MltG [Pseudomonadota bacterium]|nr:endolytic transglycosylase MltG [Pseudomonadota bacterium]
MGTLSRFLSALLTCGAVIAVALVWGGYVLWTAPGPASPSAEAVVIPRGSTIGTVAEALEQQSFIESRVPFVLAARMTGLAPHLKAGEYAFPARASLGQIIGVLREGKPLLRRFTVPEGYTSVQIVRLLEQEEALTGTIDSQPPEGALLPETYLFSRGDSRTDILKRMKDAMDQALTGLWDKRIEGLPFTTPMQAVTLASIVEKETGVATERPRVAGVFINRLKTGMPLQSDPTVSYAVTKGKEVLDRPLSRKDLALNSPYNTYVVPGLPPGPIANPGLASLKAVLDPEKHDFLYFVADGTGGHVFARSLEEHNKNVSAWRRLSDGKQETGTISR